MPVQVKRFVIGPVQVNCSVLYDESSLECVIVDPGGYRKEMKKILHWIKQHKLQPQAILITHAHLDHILGIRTLTVNFPSLPVYLHEGDIFIYEAVEAQCQMFGISQKKKWSQLPTPSHPVHDELLFENLKSSSLQCQVIHTPGHSPGSVSYYFPREQLLCSGDTLFRFNIGRTDLMGGDFTQIISSIRDRLYALPGDTQVIPGHGPDTTVASEKENNIFTQENPSSGSSVSPQEVAGSEIPPCLCLHLPRCQSNL